MTAKRLYAGRYFQGDEMTVSATAVLRSMYYRRTPDWSLAIAGLSITIIYPYKGTISGGVYNYGER